MRMTLIRLLAVSLVASSAVADAQEPKLDGGSSLPAQQSNSYRFQCPDGQVVIEVSQKRGDYAVLTKLNYSNRRLSLGSNQINEALRKFRALGSVSPRCLTGGGAQILLAGLKRDETPRREVAFIITIDKHGQISLGDRS